MKKALTVLLAVAMMFCFSATAFAAQFNDVDNSSKVAKDAINKVAALGIVDGYDDGGFHPGDTITRAEFAKMADIASGLKDSAKQMEGVNSEFTDVKTGVWYTGWVNLASAQGYVKGYENGTFGPNNTITYAEVVTVLMRLLGYSDNLTGPWPINYINQATKLDVLDDVENFSANANATRSDVAIMLSETLDQKMVKWNSDDNEFQDKEKDKHTYTLLDDAFDGVTDQYIVTAVDVKDAAKMKYTVNAVSYDDVRKGKEKPETIKVNCDADTAVAGVEPNALVDRQVTVVYDDDKDAAYIQVDDQIIKVGKAEKAKNPDQIKLDGSTYDIAAYAETKKVDNEDVYTWIKYFDTTKRNNADGNETGYALINDDDEVVAVETDENIGAVLYGYMYLVTDVDTDDKDEYQITLNDETDIDANADDIILVKNGKRVATTDLKAGDVLVEYTDEEDAAKVSFFNVVTDAAVTGEVTAYEEGASVTVGGVDYTTNTNTVFFDDKYESKSSINLKDLSDNKDKITVYKGTDNALWFIIDGNKGSSDNYAILLDKTGSTSAWGNNDYKVESVKVFTKDGETKTIAVKDKASVRTEVNAIKKGDVFTYELNKDGEIKSATAIADVKGYAGEYAANGLVVSNNKYVKVDNTNRTVNNDAVIFNLKDDYEAEKLTKAQVLAGDDISSGALDEDAPDNINYIYVVLDDDNHIKFMAITNFGGGDTVDYALINTVKGSGSDYTITFDGDSKVYDLEEDSYTVANANKGAAAIVSYKLSGNTVKDVKVVENVDDPKGITVSTYADGLVTLSDGNSYEIGKDCVFILNDKGDLSFTTEKSIKKDKGFVGVIDPDTENDDVQKLELVVIFK